jgi:hypothetical protein
MIGRLFCGPAPERPPPAAEVKESTAQQHGSLVSIGGIRIAVTRRDRDRRNPDPDSVAIERGEEKEEEGEGGGEGGEGEGGGEDSKKGESVGRDARFRRRRNVGGVEERRRGVGVLIHATLVLTSHGTVPDAASARSAEITVCRDIGTLAYVKRRLVPEM